MPTGEYAKVGDQNHRIAVNITNEGYVLVVQADGNTRSGVLGGNMLLALQENRKAAGLVVHGVIRDYAEAATQDFPIWTQDSKTTTDYDAQHDIAPLAVNGRRPSTTVTLRTSQLFSGWLKAFASRNISHISITLLTSQPFSGWLNIFVLSNIQFIFVTLLTSHLSNGWLNACVL